MPTETFQTTDHTTNDEALAAKAQELAATIRARLEPSAVEPPVAVPPKPASSRQKKAEAVYAAAQAARGVAPADPTKTIPYISREPEPMRFDVKVGEHLIRGQHVHATKQLRFLVPLNLLDRFIKHQFVRTQRLVLEG